MRTMTRILLAHSLALVAGLGFAPAAGLAASAKPKTVGTVTALAGSQDLTRSGQRLARGAKLRTGDRIVMGAGVTATLRLDRPKGVSADTDLVKLVDAPGTSHAVSTSRQASGRLVVHIVTTPGP